jgi:hypothetical protein
VLGQARKSPDAAADAHDEDDADVELPFAVELGVARSGSGYFAVGGIDSRRGASFAFVALVEADGGSGKTVELGRVFGEPEPPAFSALGEGFIGLVAGNDAGAGLLKIVSVAPPFTEATLRRGAEITGMRRDAAEFALEVSAGSVLAAWTRLEKGDGRIALGRIDPERLTLQGEPFPAPAPLAGEAESPRLITRPGGFFLAWVARTAAARPKLVPARKIDADAGAPANLLDEGPTGIEIAVLDGAGVAVGSARRVTPEGARVVAFDLAKAPDGGALVVYRDERDGPGLDRPDAQAVWIHPDGSHAARSWELGDSAGLPSLLADPAPAPDKPWAWVFVPSERELSLAPLVDPLALPEILRDDRSRGAEALAQAGGRFLLARGKNGQRELSVVECQGSTNAAPRE